jgi:membrane associated rhomboid family serine protease
VLRWIAAATEPWFPSVHAKQTGTPRDPLDDPLSELRLAGLIKIVTWVRGVGQGYALTDVGRATVAGALALPPPDAVPPPPTDPIDSSLPPPPVPTTLLDLRPPVVTPAMLIANVLWFFIGLVVAIRVGVSAGEYLGKGNTDVLGRIGAVTGTDLLRGEWWRLATCCFVHFGALHLVLNMLVLGVLGPHAEVLWGRRRTAVIYALSGLGGSCLAMALRPTAEGGAETMLAGASGAIWGILTSLLAWLVLHGMRLPTPLANDLFRRLGLMLAVNAVASFADPRISWEGHLGGGLAGLLAAGLLDVARAGDRQRRAAAVVVLVLLPVLFVTGLMLVAQSGRSWGVLRDRVAQGDAARREADEEAHRQAFKEQVTALLPPITPERVAPAEGSAVWLLARAPQGFFRTTAARARVAALRSAAAAAEAGMSGPPTGVPELDHRRERVREYAAARGRELDLLAAMFAARAVPDVPAWQAWGDARREADRLWDELTRK